VSIADARDYCTSIYPWIKVNSTSVNYERATRPSNRTLGGTSSRLLSSEGFYSAGTRRPSWPSTKKTWAHMEGEVSCQSPYHTRDESQWRLLSLLMITCTPFARTGARCRRWWLLQLLSRARIAHLQHVSVTPGKPRRQSNLNIQTPLNPFERLALPQQVNL
jgi:hypothetical protein